MFVGYARVSTQDQKPELQIDALKAAGCDKIFEEKASGAKRDRPELQALLDYVREDDTIVVWKLDRLARSLASIINRSRGAFEFPARRWASFLRIASSVPVLKRRRISSIN